MPYLTMHRRAVLLVFFTEMSCQFLAIVISWKACLKIFEVEHIPELKRLVRVGNLKALASGPLDRPVKSFGRERVTIEDAPGLQIFAFAFEFNRPLNQAIGIVAQPFDLDADIYA